MDQQGQHAARSRVFVSFPKQLPTEWVGLVLRAAQGFGVDARVYHGIPNSPPPQTNTAEVEARGEMFLQDS
jgi:hypothetical protein